MRAPGDVCAIHLHFAIISLLLGGRSTLPLFLGGSNIPLKCSVGPTTPQYHCISISSFGLFSHQNLALSSSHRSSSLTWKPILKDQIGTKMEFKWCKKKFTVKYLPICSLLPFAYQPYERKTSGRDGNGLIMCAKVGSIG